MKADIDPISLLNHAIQMHKLGWINKEDLANTISNLESKIDNYGEFKNMILYHIES